MENITESEATDTYFCQCVREIAKKDAERARQVREGYARLGLEMPPVMDNTRTMTVAERLGLK